MLVLVSLFIEIAISYWIIRTIGNRIQFISQEAEKIANREFSNVPLAGAYKDELQPIYQFLNKIRESFKEITDNANNVASGNYFVDFVPKSEKDVLGNSLRMMTSSLRKKTQENEKHNWMTNGQNFLNEKLRGDKTESVLAKDVITFYLIISMRMQERFIFVTILNVAYLFLENMVLFLRIVLPKDSH